MVSAEREPIMGVQGQSKSFQLQGGFAFSCFWSLKEAIYILTTNLLSLLLL